MPKKSTKFFIGDKIWHWEIISDELKRGKHLKYLCRCSCGIEREVYKFMLSSNRSKSCGCSSTENVNKHGFSDHPLYNKWSDIKRRCNSETNKAYKYYGNKGIKICREWEENAGAFISWCLDNGWKEGLEIDRIDNDGDYEPSNCRFTTHQENCLNQRLLNSKNKSGYCGVYYYNTHKYYKGQIGYKNKRIFSKSGFESPISAAIARDTFIIENNLPHKLNLTYLKPNINGKNGWANH